jgi:error-prone DNA polymerase
MAIRRQRPRGNVVFITLEDEFGHVPLMVFLQVYGRQERRLSHKNLISPGSVFGGRTQNNSSTNTNKV